MANDTYSSVVHETQQYLIKKGATRSGAGLSNKQIVTAIAPALEEQGIGVTVGTILNYLSYAANKDDASGIVSGGPRRGYWYSEPQESGREVVEPEEQEVSPRKGKQVTVLERDLYPLVELWLEQKGYQSKDVSSLKKGGKWGNPDIVGANRVDLFGAVEIDIASCEIKLSDNYWEQVIFEAISHKRFSNRS